jgi:outer membrane usher protein FimD/PapC
VQQNINAQAAFTSPVGLFIVSGDYSTSDGIMKAEQLALNVATQLNLEYIGPVYINGSYGSLAFAGIQQKTASIGFSKAVWFGSMNVSYNSFTGPRIELILPIPIK